MKTIEGSADRLVTHKKMKHDTLMRIIDAVKEGRAAKKTIQEKLNLSWGTCSEGINYLQSIGILEAVSETPAKPGPRGSIYAVSRERFLIMGIEAAVGEIRCTVCSLGGSPIVSNAYPCTEELNNFNTPELLKDAFFSTLASSCLDAERIYALGFALTGALDRDRMTWIQSPLFKGIANLSFEPLAALLPGVNHIYIAHDVQCRAMDVVREGHYRKSEFIMLHLAEGVGMAACEGGRWAAGHRGLAGEIGHIPYPGPSLIPGHECFCGKEQCLETFLDYRRLLEYCNTRGRARGELECLSLIDPESPEYEALYTHLETLLLYTCVILANIFDPSCLIISGRSIDPWVQRFKEHFPAKLAAAAWEGGPGEIIWIDEADTSPSRGACLPHSEYFCSLILREREESAEPAA